MVSSKRAFLTICEFLLFVAMLGLVRPPHSYGQNRAFNPDSCDHKANAPGKAKGLDKKCHSAGSSSGIAKGDFNGDGFADLAIGVPGKDSPSTVKDSGAVIVIYGSANGLTATDPAVPAAQFWSQNAVGIPGVSEAGDRFGSALASGDFNGDGFSDLAIGIPFDFVLRSGLGFIGRVVVIFGSDHGLTADSTAVAPAQSFSMLDINDPTNRLVYLAAQRSSDLPADWSTFGSALAWGDFNHDGVGDLAVGAPTTTLDNGAAGTPTAGAVGVLYGVKNVGLSSSNSQLWTEDGVIGGQPHEGDRFGATLTSGDFNGDGRSDLAIGAPNHDDGSIVDAGFVDVIYGSGSGLTAAGNQVWGRSILNVVGEPHAFDRFGWSLAAGDFNGDGRSDLAVGVPFEAINGAAGAGSVQIFSGSSTGLTATGNKILTQNSLFSTTLASESNDGFGFALASGDFNGDGRADLGIGVPFQDFFNTPNAGEVDVIYGSATNGLSPTAGPGSQSWHQSFGGVTTLGGTADPGDEFGLTLSAWNFGNDFILRGTLFKTADLAVGVPFEDLFSPVDHVTPIPDAGAVNVIYGGPTGLTTGGNQFWSSDSNGIPGVSVAGDTFGLGLY